MFVGVGASRVRDMFQKARKNVRSLLHHVLPARCCKLMPKEGFRTGEWRI